MSGVFGVWQRDGRTVNDIALAQCLTQLTPAGPSGTDSWSAGSIAMGAKAPVTIALSKTEHEPFSFADTVCVLDGRLDNRDELCALLNDHPLASADAADSHLVLAAFDRFGEAFVEHLEGDFALGIYDGRMQRLLIARDRLGVHPLCYAELGQTLLFASEAKALLRHPGMTAVPDDAMAADFFLYFLAVDGQTRTYFRDVHSLPPAHLLIATREHLSVRRYFDFDTTRRLRFPAFRDYANAFHDRFVAAVRDRLRSRSPVAISVSGGLDSSYIFCVAQRLVREEPELCPAVLGFNYGGPAGTSSDERRFVAELEHACGVKIEHIPQRPGFMACAADDVWHSESPRVDGVACLRDTVLRAVHRSGARRFLMGTWGDQLLSDSDYLMDFVRTRRWRLVKQHRTGWRISVRQLSRRWARDLVERHAPPLLHSALRRVRRRSEGAWRSPWFTSGFQKILLDRFTADRLPRPEGTSHARAIYWQIRAGYFLQCMEWNTRVAAIHDLEVAFPYLDGRLIQFLMSIPGDVQSHNGVPRGLMREAMRGVVPDAIIDRRSKGEFTDLGNAGIEHDFAAIRDLLGPDALSVHLGYVDGPVLGPLLDQWRMSIRTSDSAVLADRIINLCGLELLLRRFFSHPPC